MMADKNYIYSIKGLLIPRHENRERIIEGIKEYVELIPELTESLKVSINNNKTAHFVRNMETALSLLRSVCARWLATDAESILRSAKREQMDMCRKLITPFITDLLSLSIEMQMAKERTDRDTDIKQSKIETYTDIVNNVTAIGKLAAEAEYDRARELLSYIADLDGDETAAHLTDALTNGDGNKAATFIRELRERYIGMIVRLGGSKSGFEQKILAVDDRPEILTTVGRILKERYKVLCAPGGSAAIKIFVEQKPDLFILDIEMPGMDGFTLAKTIRGFEEHAKTPIIFLTSNANKEYVVKAMESGGNDFIVKPPNHDILLAKADKYLM